jgi:hypothetical protein
MQTTEWTLVKTSVDEIISIENPPQGMHFVVSAEVGYHAVPKATAEQEADQLAQLASQKLGYPIGGGPNDAYPAQDGNATLHIVNPDAGAPINNCNL